MATETTAPIIIHSLWVMTAVALILMLLRFSAKLRYGKKFALDDLFLVASWVFLALYASLTILSTKYGIGNHMADIHPDDLSFAIKVLYAGEFFAIIAVATSKTSFAITLLRLSPKPWQRYVLWFIIVSLNLAMWLCAMFQYLQCSPVNKLWDFTVPGKCWDPMVQIHYAMFAGSYSAAMDFALALIPWVIMWRLQMKRAEKLGISLAMSLGVLAGIAAAVKTSYLNDIARSTDFTYTSANLLVWAGCETAVTIMGSSVPYFRLAIREASRKSMARSRYAGSYQLDDAGMDSGGPRSYNPSKSSRIGRTTVVESGSGRQWDSGSDKEILGSQGKDMGNAIVMTSRITVEHH